MGNIEIERLAFAEAFYGKMGNNWVQFKMIAPNFFAILSQT